VALSDGEIATQVLKRLGLPIEQRPNIFVHIPAARVAVARAAGFSQDESRKTLQHIFTPLSIASQAIDLSSSVNLDPKTAEPMLITYPFPAVRVGSAIAIYKADYQLLQLGTIRSDQIFYAMEGNVIHFRNKTTVTGTASITSQIVPLTANWPAGRYEIELIDETASRFGGR